MNYLGMRLPGQLQQSNRRSHAFTSQFSDPFLLRRGPSMSFMCV